MSHPFNWPDPGTRHLWFCALQKRLDALYPHLRPTKKAAAARERLDAFILDARRTHNAPPVVVSGNGELHRCLVCEAGPFTDSTCPLCGDDETGLWLEDETNRGYP